jgi:adenine-specific DNA-methyltransferase
MSIDDNEVVNARKLCDEVFGEANFVAQFSWAAGRKNDSKHVSISHEYIVTYFKNVQHIANNKIIWRERKQGLDEIYGAYDSFRKQFGADNAAVEKALKGWYSALPEGHPSRDHSHYNKVDDKGVFFASDISWPGGGGPKYEVLHPGTKKPVTVPSRGWITNSVTLKQWIIDGRVHFGDNETSVPTLKSYLREHETGVPYSVFYKDGRAASKRLKDLLGEKVFENPKDEEILQRLIEFSGTGDSDIVLDFFSGSASMAHALFLAEAKNTLGRRFILVQLPEAIDPSACSSEKAKKVARNAEAFLDSINAKHTICEIGKERIRRAGKKIVDELAAKNAKAAKEQRSQSGKTDLFEEASLRSPRLCDSALKITPNIDIGFRVFKVDSSNMDDIYFQPLEVQQQDMIRMINNVKTDRTALDLLFGCLLEWGLPIDLPITKRTDLGNDTYDVDGGRIIASFDSNVGDAAVKAIANEKPDFAIFRDLSFNNSAAKINVGEIFKAISPNTQVKVL